MARILPKLVSRQATQTFDHCVRCPHVTQITSRYTGDSFDMGDVDTICQHPDVKKTKHVGAHATAEGRMISCSDRTWQAAKEPIPDWCPLPKAKA